MHRSPRRSQAAFTLIETLIAVALVAVIAALAAPSFRDMILMQRLRGVNAQLATDLNYARSESISRGSFIHVKFQASSGMSCYILFTRPNVATSPSCDCTAAAGARCTDAALTEVRTVQIDAADSVFLQVRSALGEYIVDPRTGGLPLLPLPGRGAGAADSLIVDTLIDAGRSFRTEVGPSGRLKLCTPAGSNVGGSTC